MSTVWVGHSLKISVEFGHIDVKKLESTVEGAVMNGMDKLRNEIDKKWRAKAKNILDGDRRKAYLKGLSVTRSGLDVDVKLTGSFPVAIEEGAGRFDMKPGILKNLHSRVIPMGPKNKPKFRTMVATSSGWWHPGFQGSSIHTQVEKLMPTITDDVFKPLLSRIKL